MGENVPYLSLAAEKGSLLDRFLRLLGKKWSLYL
jgi:hypothetical protein